MGPRLDSPGGKEHVNQHVEQSRWASGRLRPVDRPLVDDADNEVAKDGVEEEHLWDKFGINVERFFEMNVVRHLETDCKSHLDKKDEILSMCIRPVSTTHIEKGNLHG